MWCYLQEMRSPAYCNQQLRQQAQLMEPVEENPTQLLLLTFLFLTQKINHDKFVVRTLVLRIIKTKIFTTNLLISEFKLDVNILPVF